MDEEPHDHLHQRRKPAMGQVGLLAVALACLAPLLTARGGGSSGGPRWPGAPLVRRWDDNSRKRHSQRLPQCRTDDLGRPHPRAGDRPVLRHADRAPLGHRKIATTLSSISNTVTIAPSGFSAGGQPAKNLSTAELAPITHLHGVTSLDETLNGTALARTSLRPATFSPALYLSGSTQPANPVNVGASALRIVSGHAISGTARPSPRRHRHAGRPGHQLACGPLKRQAPRCVSR